MGELGICNRTVAVSKGYLTTVLVTVNAAPAKNPETDSCCVFFEVAIMFVVVVDFVGVVGGLDSGRVLAAAADEDGVKDATAIVAKEATNADRDIVVDILVLLLLMLMKVAFGESNQWSSFLMWP